MTIALIYDDTLRPDTTGVHCRQALVELGHEVVHVLPPQLDNLPAAGFDLYLHIDDGLRYLLPERLHPCAWWAIDTHLSYDWDVQKARGFDWVFAAQKDGAERLRADGIASAQWLPLAANPAVHRRHEVEKTVDVCFIGNLVVGERTRLLEVLRREFPSTFIGRLYGDEMARAYSQARIVFNRSVRNDVNMRVFEALACGSLLVTNDLSENGQADLFQNGVHLVTYREEAAQLGQVRD
jgi:spore maturation protein CgeB